jgi:hypothetical protein
MPAEIPEQALPDKIDESLRVTSPGIWCVVLAFIVLATSVIIWGATGTLPETTSAKGVVQDGQFICYINIENSRSRLIGKAVNANFPTGDSFDGKVSKVSEYPLSSEEISKKLSNEWLFTELVNSDYAYEIKIDFGDNKLPKIDQTEVADVVIILDYVKPLEYILN